MGSGAWAQVPGHAQDAVWTEPGNWGQLTGTNLKFSTWLVCHGTGLFVTVLFNSNEKKKTTNYKQNQQVGVKYGYGKSPWENKYCQTGRGACSFLEVCSQDLVMFYLCFNVYLSIWLYSQLHYFSFFFLSRSACQLKALDLCLEPTNVFARLDSIIPTSFQWTAFRVSVFAWVLGKEKERKKERKQRSLIMQSSFLS